MRKLPLSPRDSRPPFRVGFVPVLILQLVATTGCHVADATKQPATQPAPERFTYSERKLGSDFNLTFHAPDRATADAAARAAFARVDELDRALSDYDPESELRKLCLLTRDGPMREPVAVSPDLARMLRLALDAAEKTDGVFDPTVGPMVELWRWSRRQQQLPSAERLAAARQSVGWRNVKLQDGKVQLLAGKMRLDFGAIAGGFIADEVRALLAERGINSSLIDCSGDLAVGDPPPGRDGWVIAIRDLANPNQTAGYIKVARCGVSTSGDTYRFVEIDGVRYSHIVDPKTGLGLTHRVGVTTIAADPIIADWLATTLSVLGPDRGSAFVDRLNGEKPSPAIGFRLTTAAPDGTFNISESERYKQAKSEPLGGH